MCVCVSERVREGEKERERDMREVRERGGYCSYHNVVDLVFTQFAKGPQFTPRRKT